MVWKLARKSKEHWSRPQPPTRGTGVRNISKPWGADSRNAQLSAKVWTCRLDPACAWTHPNPNTKMSRAAGPVSSREGCTCRKNKSGSSFSVATSDQPKRYQSVTPGAIFLDVGQRRNCWSGTCTPRHAGDTCEPWSGQLSATASFSAEWTMCQGSKNRPTYVQGTNRGTSSRTLKVMVYLLWWQHLF